MLRRRNRHFGSVFPIENRPLRRRDGALAEFHRLDGRSEVRKPDIIPVQRGELRLRHTSRWPSNSADPRALSWQPRGPQTYNFYAHLKMVVLTFELSQ